MIEAMKQALEALERSVATCFDQYAHRMVMSQPDHFIHQAITSLRQAIAESSENGLYREGYHNGYGFGEAAGKRQAIAEAEKQDKFHENWQEIDCPACGTLAKAKFQFYTHPQPKSEQEPLLLSQKHLEGYWCADLTCKKCYSADFRFKHTHPQPKREWVGLTHEEVDTESAKEEQAYGFVQGAIWAEAKLKDKNL